MKIRCIAMAAVTAVLFVACAGAPKTIPEGLSARELVQRAQESSDKYNYEAAVAYYQALSERFGADPLYKTTADYEIAFIAYKKGRYAEAKEELENLLVKFAGPAGESLPQHYAVLSKKVLESIAEKTKSKEKK